MWERCQTSGPIGTKFGTPKKCGKDAKQLYRSGPNLAHVCIFIWEWTSAKNINLSSPKRYLEGVRRSQIQKCGKDAKQLYRSGPNLAHVYSSGNGHELKINPSIPDGHEG